MKQYKLPIYSKLLARNEETESTKMLNDTLTIENNLDCLIGCIFSLSQFIVNVPLNESSSLFERWLNVNIIRIPLKGGIFSTPDGSNFDSV